MSINITVHGNPTNICREKSVFADLESVKKSETDKRRKLRLEQVRQQSKELAAKVRNKFNTAKEKELSCVEKIKSAEMRAWQQRNIEKLQNNYQKCMENVGEAHKAASDAEKCDIWFQEKRAMDQIAALRRGNEATDKLQKENREKERKKIKRKAVVSKPGKSIGIQVSVPSIREVESIPQKHIFPEVRIVSNGIPTTSTNSSKSSSLAYSKNTANIPNILTSSDEEEELHKPEIISLSSASEDEDCYDAGKHHQHETQHYNPKMFLSQPTLPPESVSSIDSNRRFTQVSDFIKKRQEERQKSVQFGVDRDNSFIQDKARSPIKHKTKLIKPPKQIIVTSQTSLKGKENTLKALKSHSPIKQVPQKVQYYDSNNKFSKEYLQPNTLVQRNEKASGDLNAMEAAVQHEEAELYHLLSKKTKNVERSKSAFEKLQIRKDYESLAQELDALAKSENQVKGLGVSSKTVLSENKIKQMHEERQKKLNNAVESLLQKRIVITCPIVRDPPSEIDLLNRPSNLNVAGSSASKPRLLEESISSKDLNTSDSCTSILIGYEKPPSGSKGDRKIDEVKKLKDLLEQISAQKDLLTLEIEKQETENKENVAMQENMLKMKERQQLIQNEGRMLEEREQNLRIKEKKLEEKIKKMDKMKQQTIPIEIKTSSKGKTVEVRESTLSTTTSSENTLDNQSTNDVPVKIIITVNDKSRKKSTKTPKKEAKRVKRNKGVNYVDELSKKPGKVYPKTPYKLKTVEEIREPVEKENQSPISSIASTIYRDLPDKLNNKMSQYLQSEVPKHQLQKVAPNDAKKKDTNLVQKVAPVDTKKATNSAPKMVPVASQKKATMNPNLMQYITRLLGMSRQSIDQLGVSTSTSISTPGDSVVNVSANKTSDDALSFDESRIDKLKKFIDDNYHFLNEIDETLRNSNLNGTDDENVDKVEDIWMKTLTQKEKEIRREKPSILKKKTEPSPVTEPRTVKRTVPEPIKEVKVKPSPEPIKDTQKPIEVVESSLKSILKSPKVTPPKYAKIITPQGHVELINLGDRDEQEILEKYSLLTENCSKRISELSSMITKVREEKKKLIENSLSSSEPQNSTEYMDYPSQQPQQMTSNETSPRSTRDDPVSEEINNIFEARSRQIGFSKDSGIAMSRPVTSSDFRDSPDARPSNAAAQGSSEDVSLKETHFEPLLKDIPKVNSRVLLDKSPISPIHLHENHQRQTKGKKPPLAIARYSPQLDEGVAHELSTIMEVETPLASKLNISLNESNEPNEAERLLIDARTKLLAQHQNISYEKFPKYDEYVRENKLDATKYDPEMSSQLNLKLKEFLEVSGTSDLLAYQKFPEPEFDLTNETGQQTTVNNDKTGENSQSSSSSSLPDIVAELKRRNIIDHSFRNSLDNSNRSTPLSTSPAQNTTVKKKPIRSKDFENDLLTNNSVSDGTETLERDLNKMGLSWASTMLKKNQEVQVASSSSSLSILEDLNKSTSRKSKLNNSIISTGKQLNLKDFLARELMIRTQSDLNSLSDSSSLSSQFLRSYQNMSSPAHHKRTSTPVATRSLSSTPIDGLVPPHNGSNGLFSGESRLSSVHSDSNLLELTVPNFKLDIEKYKSSSGSSAD